MPARTRRIGWFEWPEGAIRAGVLLLVLVTALVVVVRLPTVLRDLEEEAASNSALSFTDREIAGGNALVADQAVAYAARSLIPEDASYHVAVDGNYRGGTDLTVPYVETYYHYFLMPRRPADDAEWVVCYACDLAEEGDRATVVWRGPEDTSIVRIRR